MGLNAYYLEVIASEKRQDLREEMARCRAAEAARKARRATRAGARQSGSRLPSSRRAGARGSPLSAALAAAGHLLAALGEPLIVAGESLVSTGEGLRRAAVTMEPTDGGGRLTP